MAGLTPYTCNTTLQHTTPTHTIPKRAQPITELRTHIGFYGTIYGDVRMIIREACDASTVGNWSRQIGCLFVYISAYLSGCMLACLLVRLCIGLSAHRSVYVCVCLPACVHASLCLAVAYGE